VHFVDEVAIDVAAGHGGDGCVAFRREKYRPLGGPAGGNGGDGGSVVLSATDRLSTLLDLRYKRKLRAESGEPGRGKDQYGKGGADLVVPVPVGTQVFDDASGELLFDLDADGMRVVVVRGGRGGRGNMQFATPENRSPRIAEPGEPGEERRIRLELKLLADVGVVGFPNAGKSTFIAAVSRARPKIADYPFTTLTPNLGVVSLGDDRSFVIADIPGIIEGAAEGAGLGLRFLKHVERCRVLIHLVTVDPAPGRSPVADYEKLMAELEKFDPDLAKRPMVVALSKMDLPEVREVETETREALAERGIELLAMSAATRDGVPEVLRALERTLTAHPRPSVPRPRPLPPPAERPHGDTHGFPGEAESEREGEG
jgi:GTP-binding protein